MGFFDNLFADPYSTQGIQNAGLFGGLQALGAGLAQAGQMRPVGQPGPSLGDAFLAYGRGNQAGLLGAYQQSKMNADMRRRGLLSEAMSDKPDDQITPEVRQIRVALSSLPPEIRALAGPDELPGLAIKRGTERMRPMTAEELRAGGFRPGSVVMVNDFTGAPNVVQQSQLLDPAEEAQKIRISAAGRQPPAPTILGPGQVAVDRNGKPIAFGPMPKDDPLTPANAWNDILRYQGQVEAGTLDPNSPEGRRYIAAQEILLQPKPVQITQPDGSVIQVLQQPQLTFPRLTRPAPAAAPDGATPAAAAPALPAQPGATATPQGTVVKPPPPLTESQGNATMYLQRMIEAEKRMADTVAGGYVQGNMRDQVASALPLVGNFAISEKGQNYRQAQEDWVRAYLRKQSGAVIGKEEMDREINTFFPKPGDSESTVRQKAAARQTAVDGMRAVAGPGADRMVNTPPPSGGASGRDPLGLLK